MDKLLVFDKSAAHLGKNMENLYKWKLCSRYGIESKTLWQKENLLIMSNNSFCYNVFKTITDNYVKNK